MRHNYLISIFGATMLMLFSSGFSVALAEEGWPTESECKKLENPTGVLKGWCAAIDRRRGNCLSCHNLYVTPWPDGLPVSGNIAPTLVKMKVRFPDKAALRAQVSDATQANPTTVMPPFGRHMLLSGEEIDNIVEFLHAI